jgi:preprotein translocase subunit SecE
MARRPTRLEVLTIVGYVLAVLLFVAGFAVIVALVSRAAPS